MKQQILITGASGFIGSFLVEEALRRDYEVWAAVRPTSSRQYLSDERIHFIELDLDSPEQLAQALRERAFTYVIHAAGLTKSLHHDDFFRVNTRGTRHLVEALRQLHMPLRRFVYLSSLSVFGPIREQQPYTDITDADTPRPNTAYGLSKLQAEAFLASLPDDFPYVILRPTGVYGPRERDYYMMAQSIRSHTDFAVGYRRQDITFIYVKDLVEAAFLALDNGPARLCYFLSDGQVYQSADFSRLIRRELGNPWCLRITAPLWVLRAVTFCGERWGRLTGRITALNDDKYHILRQRNWRCDIEPARRLLGYSPQYPLERGVAETISWYQEQHWL